MPTYPVLTEGVRPGAAIMSEGNFHISREEGLVPAETVIAANALVARMAAGAAAVGITTSYAGTGNGVLTLASPAYNGQVKNGVYKATCITVAANGGTFRVEDPEGKEIGSVAVGAAFNKAVKFTIADGATDFALGDEFSLNVSVDEEDFVYVPFVPAGTDGSEVPVAYSIYSVVTLANQTKSTALITNDAELNGNCINWPAGITDVQRNDAINALRERGIKVRY